MHTVRILDSETKLHVKVAIAAATGQLDVDEIRVILSDEFNEVPKTDQQELLTTIRSDDADAVGQLIEENPDLLECRIGTADNGTPLTIASRRRVSRRNPTTLKSSLK